MKAGSDQSTDGNTNTIFAEPPSAGQIVWADSNPDFKYGGRRQVHLAHHLLPGKIPTPEPGSLKAVKEWNVTGVEGDPAGTPGTLTFNADVKDWNTSYEYPAGTDVTVTEAGDGTAPNVEGYKCTLDTAATTYQVGDGQASTTPPTVTITSDTTVTVTITNTANCEEITPEPGSLKAVKEWNVTGVEGDPAGTPGTLTFNADVKDWNTSYEYPAGTDVTVTEAGDGTAPNVEGYKCTLDTAATTYQVGDGQASTTPPTVTITSDTTVTVTITNTANCEEITPEPGSLKAVKEWNVTGVEGDPAGTPGTLTFNADVKDWNTSYEYPAGTDVTVTEAGDGTAPNVEGYKCTLDTAATTYQVGDDQASTTPPTVTITSDTTVTVTITNTANCTKIPPPPATTTLTVTKAWVGVPAEYTLTAADAGALTVTVDGVATGQAWNATQAGLKVGDKFTVTEGPVSAPELDGYTCEISGSPAYSVNGGAFVSPAPTVPLAPSPNTVVVQNTVTCTADEVVGGIEEGGETPEETPDGGTVGGTEDDLAATGANLGPAGLGLLLILSGAALLGGRRFATR